MLAALLRALAGWMNEERKKKKVLDLNEVEREEKASNASLKGCQGK